MPGTIYHARKAADAPSICSWTELNNEPKEGKYEIKFQP
jgi:hypothetical protein